MGFEGVLVMRKMRISSGDPEYYNNGEIDVKALLRAKFVQRNFEGAMTTEVGSSEGHQLSHFADEQKRVLLKDLKNLPKSGRPAPDVYLTTFGGVLFGSEFFLITEGKFRGRVCQLSWNCGVTSMYIEDALHTKLDRMLDVQGLGLILGSFSYSMTIRGGELTYEKAEDKRIVRKTADPATLDDKEFLLFKKYFDRVLGSREVRRTLLREWRTIRSDSNYQRPLLFARGGVWSAPGKFYLDPESVSRAVHNLARQYSREFVFQEDF